MGENLRDIMAGLVTAESQRGGLLPSVGFAVDHREGDHRVQIGGFAGRMDADAAVDGLAARGFARDEFRVRKVRRRDG